MGIALKYSSFKAIVPKKLIAKRSVIMRNVDRQLMCHSEEEIKRELLLCNPWCLTDDVPNLLETFKIGITIVKLIFNSTNVTETPVTQGVSCFTCTTGEKSSLPSFLYNFIETQNFVS